MVLVTGANGMIGSHLTRALLREGHKVVGVDKTNGRLANDGLVYIRADLGDKAALERIYKDYPITHTIHLAALAHAKKGEDLSSKVYWQANVVNAQNVFEIFRDTNILFISTVDVYGFAKGVVNEKTQIAPVSVYGKTKAKAEEILIRQGGNFNIYRFSPVYSEDKNKDIRKRYYIKYPEWAYIIGAGAEFEALSLDNAAAAMVAWVTTAPDCGIRIIKDEKRLSAAEMLAAERAAGRAKHVLHIPRWAAVCAYKLAGITGKNKYTYLLSKAVYPLKSERWEA